MITRHLSIPGLWRAEQAARVLARCSSAPAALHQCKCGHPYASRVAIATERNTAGGLVRALFPRPRNFVAAAAGSAHAVTRFILMMRSIGSCRAGLPAGGGSERLLRASGTFPLQRSTSSAAFGALPGAFPASLKRISVSEERKCTSPTPNPPNTRAADLCKFALPPFPQRSEHTSLCRRTTGVADSRFN